MNLMHLIQVIENNIMHENNLMHLIQVNENEKCCFGNWLK